MKRIRYEARDRYRGVAARQYETRRRETQQWQNEDTILSAILSEIAPNSKVLDVPVGTGRLLDMACQRGHRILGIDVSEDMLSEARKRNAVVDGCAELCTGDIEALPLRTNSVDYAFSIRFMNWVPLPVLESALSEIDRVSIKGVVVQVKLTRPLTPREMLKALIKRVRVSPTRPRQRRSLSRKPTPTAPSARTFVHREPEFEAVLDRTGLAISKRWRLQSRASLRYRTMSTFDFLLLLPSRHHGDQ